MGFVMFPLVSIIMSTYSEPTKVVARAIDSILTQTYQNIELIIVMDNPNNVELNQYLLDTIAYKDKCKVILNDRNMGVANSRNIAINASMGDLIALQDADDISLPKRIEYQIDYLNNNPMIDIVTLQSEFVDSAGNLLNRRSHIIPDEKIEKSLKYGSILINPSAMYRRDVFIELNGYTPLRLAEDYDFWLRCINHHKKIHIMNACLFQYTIAPVSLSHKNPGKSWIISRMVFRKVYKENKNNTYIDGYSNIYKKIEKSNYPRLNIAIEKIESCKKLLQDKKYLYAILRVICGILYDFRVINYIYCILMQHYLVKFS